MLSGARVSFWDLLLSVTSLASRTHRGDTHRDKASYRLICYINSTVGDVFFGFAVGLPTEQSAPVYADLGCCVL